MHAGRSDGGVRIGSGGGGDGALTVDRIRNIDVAGVDVVAAFDPGIGRGISSAGAIATMGMMETIITVIVIITNPVIRIMRIGRWTALRHPQLVQWVMVDLSIAGGVAQGGRRRTCYQRPDA